MNPLTLPSPFPILLAGTLIVMAGCSRAGEEGRSPGTAPSVPTHAEAAGATIHGLEGDSESVTLRDGRWEGDPYVRGGASRPSVYLVPGFLLPWDADGTPPAEAVALVGENSGGSGEYIYLVVLAREGASAVNRATVLLGDRVQVVSADTAGRRLMITLLRTGPQGAMCCPDEVITIEWELRGGALSQLPPSSPPRPLTNDVMGGVEWTLIAADGPGDARVTGTPAVTLRYDDGRFQGSSGCNRYFASVTSGEMPGDILPGPVGATRMICPDSAANALEEWYLARLGAVVKFGFSAGRLMLLYEGGEGTGTLYFTRSEAPRGPAPGGPGPGSTAPR